MYIPDALDAHREHEAKMEKALAESPKCDYCGTPFQDEYCYEISGEKVCRKCLDRHFKVAVTE